MTDFVTTATVKGVELVKAGTWQGLTGPVTLTREDLADALAASQDPEVDHAALKLGHIDPRFDGQPAAGWVERLRLSDDGQTLLGDLVVPGGASRAAELRELAARAAVYATRARGPGTRPAPDRAHRGPARPDRQP